MQYFDINGRRYSSCLEDIQVACNDGAKEKGWHDQVIPFPEMISLIHSEASEALEEYREGKDIFYFGSDGKPEGIASEFADIIIRLGHYASILKIDLTDAVIKKLRYNATRSYRHGNKKA